MKLDIAQWIVNAVGIITSGVANKLEKGDVTVYKCGKIIRIDIKGKYRRKPMKGKRCPTYCGITCVNGQFTIQKKKETIEEWNRRAKEDAEIH